MLSLSSVEIHVLFEGALPQRSHDAATDSVGIGVCFLFAIYCTALSGCLSQSKLP